MTQLYDFETAQQKVRDELSHYLWNTPPVVHLYMEYLLLSKGKMLRSKALLACALNEENKIQEDAVQACVGIEILHMATLVHDDVIDNASSRRGMPTVHKKFGKTPAVICGDYLLSLALKLFFQIGERREQHQRDFPDYISRLCEGELLQQENRENVDLTSRTCLKIIRGKTAALFEGAFCAGAALSKEKEKEAVLADYRKLGRYVGMIFQLMDDCMDYVLTEEKAGKTVQSDYEQGIYTIPLIYTMHRNPTLKKRIRKGKVEKEEIIAEVQKHNGVGHARRICTSYYQKAQGILEQLPAEEEKKQRIAAVLDQAYHGIGKKA